jgi:hypothetical protein
MSTRTELRSDTSYIFEMNFPLYATPNEISIYHITSNIRHTFYTFFSHRKIEMHLKFEELSTF